MNINCKFVLLIIKIKEKNDKIWFNSYKNNSWIIIMKFIYSKYK